ncbi:DNA primase [Clostridium botulinum]|uniref:DNA primase n=2 Tax=Clostridium botulinum TaxID=1491 RepID=A0A846HWE8_CLOBO|nr:DNA primase [Clostridium botulinum]AJD26259.1 DNA primase [Clostridium botulinum CDC_297]ACQ53706.1 DNA primase [Clostridium botulinum Ba4 str. 657]AJE11717.1 DNA primase [Clostridium botulinum CDC_1436]APU58196.1 DNA primase [Clostridium botulinum]AUN04373.1 DNA primase [Clostridium botulinum]
MISEDVVQKVIELNDIVDVISGDIKLKNSGRNYFGLCPFHHEKTPSFSVSQDKQIYKCFGCGEAGNVVTYVMKTKNVAFPEAIKILAERVNIDIEEDKKENTNNPKDKIYKINVDAARYFFNNLIINKNAINYFLNRGVTKSIIKRFGLGYSKDSWDGLLRHLKTKGYTELDMLSAGLIIKSKNGSYYDRFRNRVMFPVFDYRGKVIGFGGRVLNNAKPKYLNSPETMVFKKGINLYGLNYAVKENKDRVLIIVEGYMDCITLHQYGIKNSVASLGTALTTNQARLLKRYADKVIISYDSDTAGQLATQRGLEILKDVGLGVEILTVPDGKDPDQFVKAHGKESYLKLVKEALPLIEYKIKISKQDLNIGDKRQAIQYIDRYIKIIEDLDPVEKDMYIRRLSEETNIEIQTLYDQLNKKNQNSRKNGKEVNMLEAFGQKLYLEPAYIRAERFILQLMFNYNNIYEYIKNSINEQDIIEETHKAIYKYIKDTLEDSNIQNKKLHIETLCNKNVETSKEWVKILNTNFIYKEDESKKFIDDAILNIKKYKLEKYKEDLLKKIKEYEAQGKLDDTIKMSQELIKVKKTLGAMK